MLYYTSSYEEMKQQLEEQRSAREHERLCAGMTPGRQNIFHILAEQLGSHMVRIGTWLENVGRAGALVNQPSEQV